MGAIFRLLSALLIFCLIVACGHVPLVWRSDPRKLSLANCVSAGFFLAGGMIHMLPEAHEMFVRLSSIHSVTAYMLCCCGVIGTFGIEKVQLQQYNSITCLAREMCGWMTRVDRLSSSATRWPLARARTMSLPRPQTQRSSMAWR